MLATIAPWPPVWRAALVTALVATSPALALLAAIGLVDQAALFIPPIALAGFVVGTGLIGRRVGSPDADRR